MLSKVLVTASNACSLLPLLFLCWFCVLLHLFALMFEVLSLLSLAVMRFDFLLLLIALMFVDGKRDETSNGDKRISNEVR